MEHRITKAQAELIRTLIQLDIFDSNEEEIPDTPLEEFEKGLEELLPEETQNPQ